MNEDLISSELVLNEEDENDKVVTKFYVNTTATSCTYEVGNEDDCDDEDIVFYDLEFETREEAKAFVNRIVKLVEDEKIKHVDSTISH